MCETEVILEKYLSVPRTIGIEKLEVVLLDESGDTNVNLKKGGKKTKYFLIATLILSPKCYSELSRELVRAFEEMASVVGCEDIIKKMIEGGIELKYNSLTGELVKCFKGTETKEVNEAIDEALGKFFDVVTSLRTCSSMRALIHYVNKAEIAKFLKGLGEFSEPLREALSKTMKPYVFNNVKTELCNSLIEDALVLFDEKFFSWRGISDRELPKRRFQCYKVVDAMEVKSHHALPFAIVDVLAGSYRNALLHRNERLKEKLAFARGFDLTSNFVGELCEVIGRAC
ncbi:hypothetical protein EYM_01785 [Ignicoccus islandicus DSM 13165]|uniref:DUF3800 domain-containing protein n=1 Tax=Ignicoccus islandicus DSM 13165 TaxID=940295 RepID=A0A0U3F8A2_9CREN|nr:hypothetical protein [Ignicoccus islandicus]ALU12248.1 hypothetical protein EYM_01785 [Ignicoccus islandicus DSM 13165]